MFMFWKLAYHNNNQIIKMCTFIPKEQALLALKWMLVHLRSLRVCCPWFFMFSNNALKITFNTNNTSGRRIRPHILLCGLSFSFDQMYLMQIRLQSYLKFKQASLLCSFHDFIFERLMEYLLF